MFAGLVVLVAALEAGAGAEIVTWPLLLAGLGMGALASQLGSVTVSSVPDEQSGEVGGLQNTVTNLGISVGTALTGAIIIAALSSSFLTGVEENPAVPAPVKARASTELSGGIPFLSDDELETALDEARVSRRGPPTRSSKRTKQRASSGCAPRSRSSPCSPWSGSSLTGRIPTRQPAAAAAAGHHVQPGRTEGAAVLASPMRPKGLPHSESGAPEDPLAELAERQHGVVSIRQLLGPLGRSARWVTHAAAAGSLHRLHRGVYAVGHTNLSPQGRCLAAVLACGPGALLSHGSAAWLLGIASQGPLPLEVTAPTRRRPRPPILLHHARALAPEDRAMVQWIPVTALPRTLLDRAATVRAHQLERSLERAEELREFDLDEVEGLLRRTLGHPGHGRLARAVELYREPAFTRSGLERRFLALVDEAGLPRPATGLNVVGYELDAYWPEERFAVELDVFKTHGSRAAFERDRLRQEDLKLAGVEMIRVTGKRLEREPRQVAERVACLLAPRRDSG